MRGKLVSTPIFPSLIAITAGLAFAPGCSDQGNQTAPGMSSQPEGPTARVRQPLPGCAVEMAGIGEPGEGWTILRKDGSLWRTPWAADSSTHPSAVHEHFFDNKQVVNLVDAEGEALSACAVTADKKLWCWGRNDYGQLGDGTKLERADPIEVTAVGAHVMHVGMSDTFACVLKDDGSVWCWGGNASGQLGDETTTDSPTPIQVGIGTDNEYVSVGYEHVCVKKTNKDLWCWGDNVYGEIGTGSIKNIEPKPVKVMSDVKKVSSGGFFTCAIKTDDTLWCWGDNADGHLGVGDVGDHRVPTQVTALGTNVLDVDSSVRATCALTKDGAAWCWGWPDQGRLGDGRDCKGQSGPQYQVPTPQRVHGPLGQGGAKKIFTREGSACVVTTADEIWCWGAGVYPDGQGMHLEPVKTDFCSLPDLKSLTPDHGPATGGATVTLNGTDFQDGSSVTFDGLPATKVTFVSASKLQALAPAHSQATVDVILKDPKGHPAQLLGSYTYVIGPSFDNIAPNQGPMTGGGSFLLYGGQFNDKTKVKIGDAQVTDVTMKDDSTLQGTIPAATKPGAVNVVVTNDDGQEAVGTAAYTYIAPPMLTSVKPQTGSVDGGTTVTIKGDLFDWNTVIHFGTEQATAQLDDAQTLTVSTPAHAAGKVDVTAEDSFGQKTTLAGAFTYEPNGTGGSGQGGAAGSAQGGDGGSEQGGTAGNEQGGDGGSEQGGTAGEGGDTAGSAGSLSCGPGTVQDGDECVPEPPPEEQHYGACASISGRSTPQGSPWPWLTVLGAFLWWRRRR